MRGWYVGGFNEEKQGRVALAWYDDEPGVRHLGIDDGDETNPPLKMTEEDVSHLLDVMLTHFYGTEGLFIREKLDKKLEKAQRRQRATGSPF